MHEEPLGTKPKRWLQDPVTSEYGLMKDVTSNRRADGSSYQKGDDWAERSSWMGSGSVVLTHMTENDLLDTIHDLFDDAPSMSA